MNNEELSKNRALTKYLLLDLNEDPENLSKQLGSDEPYDAAICSVSIDYLVKPRELLADLSKILKPGATVHLAFSNRCFPTKVSELDTMM
jgi:ubiquinone/menaquinone biosynthesis C-methylase UbiE